MKEVPIICRACQKQATIPINTEWGERYYKKNKERGIFACDFCSFKYGDPLIKSGELIGSWKTLVL